MNSPSSNSLSYMLNSIKQLVSISFSSSFNTENVIDMSKMFYACISLSSVENLSNLNTKNVIYMDYLFYACSLLRSIDLSKFDTSNVKDMTGMFGGSGFYKLNLSNYNNKNLLTTAFMLYSVGSLEELDISSFDTSNVIDMSYMFSYCAKLTSLDVSHFNTENSKKWIICL